MNTVHRRTEIINILIIRRHTTANELAQEFGVSIRTIQYSGFNSGLSDLYKTGRERRNFYKRGLQALCQFADTYGSSCLA